MSGPNNNRIQVRPSSTPRYRLYNLDNSTGSTPWFYPFTSSDGVSWTAVGKKPVSITLSGLTGVSSASNGTYNSFEWDPANQSFISPKSVVGGVNTNIVVEIYPSGSAAAYIISPVFFVSAQKSTGWGIGSWTVEEGTGSPVGTGTLYPTGGVPTGVVTTTTVNTDNVTTWADQSGNGNNATASGTPTLVANSLNGKSGISLDGQGSNDGFLTSPIFSLAYNTPISLFGVVKASASTVRGGQAAARWFMNKGGSEDFGIGFTFGGYQSSLEFSGFLGSIITSDINLLGDSLGENQANIASLISNGSTSTFYQNGTSKNSANNSELDFTNSSNNGFSIGYQAAVVDEFFCNCIVYELLIYNRAVSSTERQQVEAYLMDKYEIVPPVIPPAGLSLWLKADAGVTLSGSNVTSWADQSGNGNNATSPDTNPTFLSSSINSKPAISFNNDGSWMQIPQSNIGDNGNISIFIVINYYSGYIFLNKGDAATFGDTSWEFSTITGFGFVDTNNGDPIWNAVEVSVDTDTPQILEGFSNAGVSQLAFNGSNSGSPSSANVGFNNISQYIGIGGGGTNGQSSGEPLDARIAEIIIYNRQVTTPERQQVEAYLNTKYAIY
jgi:hypothetical protein